MPPGGRSNSRVELRDIIRSRRSIREYTAQIPQEKDIDRILDAGRWAPSGLNNQPWRFLPVRERSVLSFLAGCTKYRRIIMSAPCAILVFLDNADSYNRDKDLMAIGACIQNMLLEAHALGLSTCWLGEILNQKKRVHEHFALDADLELAAVITLGYADEDITQRPRKPLEKLIVG